MGPDIGRHIEINLLDHPERRAGPPAADATLTVLLAAAIVLLIPVLWLLNDIRMQTGALEKRFAAAQATLRALSVTPPELTALKTELDAVQKTTSKLDADLTALSGRRIAWGAALRAVWSEAGAAVSLAAVGWTRSAVIRTGCAPLATSPM